MQDDGISFQARFDDNQWKLFRDEDLVAVFLTHESAVYAAQQFVEELARFGGSAKVLPADQFLQ